MENMSATPHLVRMRQPSKYGNQELIDSAYYDGLRDPFYDWAMGMDAEYIAEEGDVTRQAMDQRVSRGRRSLTRPRAGWPRRRRPALFDLLRDPSA